MNQNDFQWLQKWYQKHCDGEWEHGSGIELRTLDNPGWSLSINLLDTELEYKLFKKIQIEKSDEDWLICFIRNMKFEARCSSNNLFEVLHTFRKWAES